MCGRIVVTSAAAALRDIFGTRNTLPICRESPADDECMAGRYMPAFDRDTAGLI